MEFPEAAAVNRVEFQGPSKLNFEATGSADEKLLDLPTIEQIDKEIERVSKQARHHHNVRNLIVAIVAVFAVSVLLSMLLFPMFRIYGSSMNPTLEEGDLVLSIKTDQFAQGDLIAFSYNNKLLTKRVIAGPGDWVNISTTGVVTVNGVTLDESYLPDGSKAYGKCDISLPYQVPDGKYFVMGDNRAESIDSRSLQMGAIEKDQISGKLLFRFWPITRFGPISAG